MLKSIVLKAFPDRALKFLKQRHYLYELKKFSEKDEPDLRVVKQLIRSGDHVVDIGANVGWYTKILAEAAGASGKVYSFEPVGMTFEILSYCVKRLELQNVVLRCSGLSDAEGEAVMEIPAFEKGGDNFYRAQIISGHSKAKPGKQVHVRLATLDKTFQNATTPIKFIKCDVEGHELSVIKGARAVIERFKPAWLIEVSHDPDEHGTPSNELFSLLCSYGYKAFWFNGSNLVERVPKDKSVNYFFLTVEQQRAIPC